MKNLARYIIRASFSQERMTYVPEQVKVIYESKDAKAKKTFDALEWLAAMCSHVPNKGEQMVRYYGYYSNVCRGKRQKARQDVLIPCILEPDEGLKAYRKNFHVICDAAIMAKSPDHGRKTECVWATDSCNHA